MKAQYIEINHFGTKYYYSDRNMTIRHREDGPAVEWADGDTCWYRDGKLHREDGPAVEYVDGSEEWWIDGVNMTKYKFNKILNAKKTSCNASFVK